VVRSPVLKTLLTTNMLESQTGRIELPDVAAKTGRDLVFFIYNNRIPPDADHTGLLVLADKYDIQVYSIIVLTYYHSKHNFRGAENEC
jgi:hypothetical protein